MSKSVRTYDKVASKDRTNDVYKLTPGSKDRPRVKSESELLHNFNVRGLNLSLRGSYFSRFPVAFVYMPESLGNPRRTRL